MILLNFPTLSKKQDEKYFSQDSKDPAIKTSTDGGYVLARPRYTRRPRRMFKTGFTHLNESDKVILETFWETTKGGSLEFHWIHPVTNEDILVRFQKSFTFKYDGKGINYRWNVSDVELLEV